MVSYVGILGLKRIFLRKGLAGRKGLQDYLPAHCSTSDQVYLRFSTIDPACHPILRVTQGNEGISCTPGLLPGHAFRSYPLDQTGKPLVLEVW